MIVRYVILFLLIYVLNGCTTIGLSDSARVRQTDFGEPETLKICILKDREVSSRRVEYVVEGLKDEFMQYGILIDVPWIKEWDRPGFWSSTIYEDVVTRPLNEPCDRLFALVGRDFRDLIWGVLPELLGVVDTTTHTKGFAVAEVGSLNQMVPPFAGPRDIAIHETYHLLGCGHGLTMYKCYEKIQEIKVAATKERKNGNDFFPGITEEGKILKTRNDVENELYQFVAKHIARSTVP